MRSHIFFAVVSMAISLIAIFPKNCEAQYFPIATSSPSYNYVCCAPCSISQYASSNAFAGGYQYPDVVTAHYAGSAISQQPAYYAGYSNVVGYAPNFVGYTPQFEAPPRPILNFLGRLFGTTSVPYGPVGTQIVVMRPTFAETPVAQTTAFRPFSAQTPVSNTNGAYESYSTFNSAPPAGVVANSGVYAPGAYYQAAPTSGAPNPGSIPVQKVYAEEQFRSQSPVNTPPIRSAPARPPIKMEYDNDGKLPETSRRTNTVIQANHHAPTASVQTKSVPQASTATGIKLWDDRGWSSVPTRVSRSSFGP